MLFASVLVAMHIAAFAFAAIDASLADAIIPVVQCAAGLGALALPRVRHALLDFLTRYWPAALVYGVLIVLAFREAGMLDAAPQGDPRPARAELWRLIGFALGALASAGAALAAGRRQSQRALMVGAVVLGALAIAQHLQTGASLFAAAGETAIVFTLLAALALFGAIDAIAQRAPRSLDTRSPERRQTRAERLFLPAAGLGASLIGLALTGSLTIVAAFLIAIALLAFALALRERRRGAGLLLLSALALSAAAVGGALFYLIVRSGAPGPLALAGLSGLSADQGLRLSLAVAAWVLLLGQLVFTLDRRRRPSRGLALALAGGAVALLAGPAGAAPAAFATLALLIGAAGAYGDRLDPERNARAPARTNLPARDDAPIGASSGPGGGGAVGVSSGLSRGRSGDDDARDGGGAASGHVGGDAGGDASGGD